MADTLIIGTRASQLALKQADIVKGLLLKAHPQLNIEVKKIVTSGDQFQSQQIYKFGGKGVFVKEIEEALMSKKIDLAVHSMKDLPTDIPENLEIMAILKRDDPRDAFLSKKYDALSQMPEGSVVGTSSLRRKVQVIRHFPHLKVTEIRGNIDTRIKKMEMGDYDATIMAVCGIERMGWHEKIKEKLNFVPAVSQGAIGIEARKGDKKVFEKISVLNDEKTKKEIFLERLFLKQMNGGCLAPIGAQVNCANNKFFIKTFIGSLDGSKILEHKEKGFLNDSEKIIEVLSQKILNEGGTEILESIERGFK